MKATGATNGHVLPPEPDTLFQLRQKFRGPNDRPVADSWGASVAYRSEIGVDLDRRLADEGLESTVAPPFQYALGKKHSTLDEKKRFMEDYAENILRHF